MAELQEAGARQETDQNKSFTCQEFRLQWVEVITQAGIRLNRIQHCRLSI